MEIETYLRFLAALVAVLAMIGACAWGARRLGLGGALRATKGAVPRLAVVEVKIIDSRRKLVILRRDSTEHLILLGPNRDLLIESCGTPTPSAAGSRNVPGHTPHPAALPPGSLEA